MWIIKTRLHTWFSGISPLSELCGETLPADLRKEHEKQYAAMENVSDCISLANSLLTFYNLPSNAHTGLWQMVSLRKCQKRLWIEAFNCQTQTAVMYQTPSFCRGWERMLAQLHTCESAAGVRRNRRDGRRNSDGCALFLLLNQL